MSGGYFGYHQYRLVGLKEQVEDLIKKGDYSENTLSRFKEAVTFLDKSRTYLDRIDWLVSGDDSEISFHIELETELNKGRTINLRQVKEAYNLPHVVALVIGGIMTNTITESYLEVLLNGLGKVVGEVKELPDDYDYINPAHYKKGGIEVIDIIEQYNLSYCAGNVVKYLLRYQYKGTPERDLKKAIWYLKRQYGRII